MAGRTKRGGGEVREEEGKAVERRQREGVEMREREGVKGRQRDGVKGRVSASSEYGEGVQRRARQLCE